MMRTRTLLMSTTIATMVISACNKDELTVVSTASGTNTCGKYIVDLNVDSLFSDTPPQPWGSDIEIAVCACDTLVLRPVNIPFPYEFEHWRIDQGGEEAQHNELVLDTITVNSALTLEFDHGPGHPHLYIDVLVAPCE